MTRAMSLMRIDEARTILGDDVLGSEEVTKVFGGGSGPELQAEIPFTRDELRGARRSGAMLVLRVTRGTNGMPLTILEMLQRFPQAFDPKLLRQAGYLLKEEWGIALEPLAATDTCVPGWALAQKEVLKESCNLSYDEQEAAIRHHGETLGVAPAALRRRTAVEAMYDILLYWQARNVRLLERSWDWSSSATLDRGYLNVGGFSAAGMQVLSFSRAVRHGGLGVCPTYSRSSELA